MKIFLSVTLSIVAILLGGYAVLHPQTVTQFGATSNAGANALFEQSLAQPLGTTDPNIFVTSSADVQGNLLPLNSYQCLSVDTGQPNFEAICGTVTTSSTAGLTLAITLRGLSTATATTSNSSFIFTHRRGADVRITDFPTLTVNNNELNGVQAIPNSVFYSSNFTPSFWTGAASNTIATIGIVNSTAQAGCGNANETAAGCVQLATAVQAAAGTSAGSSGARLVPPNSLLNATPSATTIIPVTSTLGKLAQGFLDIFTTNNTWAGTQLFNASSTFTATTSIAASNILSDAVRFNGIPYAFPSSQGSANQTLINNGSGVLSWTKLPTQQYSLASTSSSVVSSGGSETSSPIGIPAGVLSASSTILYTGSLNCADSGSNSNCKVSIIDTNSNDYLDYTIVPGTNRTCTSDFTIRIMANNSTSAQISVGTGGCYVSGAASWNDFSAANTTAVNWANATSFELKVTTASSMTSTLNTFIGTVTP